MFRKTIGLVGMFSVALCGAVFGGWVTNQQDPVQFLGRRLLTPVVKPGEALKVDLDNYRVLRCAQRTFRIGNRPDGERFSMTEDKPAAFGKLGRDRYTISIPTPADVPHGKATLYSYTERMCNPWEWFFPVTYGEWTDEFEFGPQTVRVAPDKARNSLETTARQGVVQ